MATDVLDEDQADDATGAPDHGLNAGRKYGPFTLPVWGIVIGGGAVIGLAIRHFQGAGSTTPANTSDAALSSQTNPANYGYTATGGPFAGGGTGSSVTGSPANGVLAATTNSQWEQITLEELIAQGTDPALAQQALGNYLDGLPLTTQQKSIVSLALRLGGSPPEGAPPIQDVPTVAAPPVDGGSGQSPVSSPVPNPSQPVSAPGGAAPALSPVQTQWVGDVLTTYGLLNQGGAVATANFSKAQFLHIDSQDPHLQPWVAIAYNTWLKGQGDPNHLSH